MKALTVNKFLFVVFIVITAGVNWHLIMGNNKSSKNWRSVKEIKLASFKLALGITPQERFVVKIFKDDQVLQHVNLETDFGSDEYHVIAIDNGFKISSDETNEIVITADAFDEDFASFQVTRVVKSRKTKITDCIPLQGGKLNWFGGPEHKTQKYPIQKFIFPDFAYVPTKTDHGSIMERYWLASNGFFILVDYETPLFVDQNSLLSDHVCFTAKKNLPYDTHDDNFVFKYRIGVGVDARVTHMNIVNNWLGKPQGIPDERLIKFPIWNSWVRYGKEVNQTLISNFIDDIKANGFKCSLLEIDDSWENCYGSLAINKTKFPDFKELSIKMKQNGISSALWVHPFINKDCEPHYTYARAHGYFVKSHMGNVDTAWWNSEKNQAAHIDFTNPEAVVWFKGKLELLKKTYGISSFKFDDGETDWLPKDPKFHSNSSLSPGILTRIYVEMAASFGDMLEVRTGWGTQKFSILVRMRDFYSQWTEFNGIKSLIPKLLQFNMNGFVFVLPDMVGGNQYHKDKVTKELFIRWLQASIFMPSLQFSFAPWQLDDETVEVTKTFLKLHEDYADLILKRCRLAVSDGDPINPPIWWLDPEDSVAQAIDDEYLLGESILAAPVLNNGVIKRDVYLPKGTWVDGNDEAKTYEGRQWIRNYKAPLHVLPYFIRV